VSLGDYLGRWLEVTKGTVGERTWIRSEVDVRVHIDPVLGKSRLDRMSALRLQSFYGTKLDSGLSPRTVQIIHATLHKVLKQAVRCQLIPRKVAESVDPPKANEKAIEPLDEGQARRLLKAAEGDELEALCVLAVTTGMCSGELLGLKWEDVDFRAETLRVNRTVFNGRVDPQKQEEHRAFEVRPRGPEEPRQDRRVGLLPQRWHPH
jgi:integrase